MSEEPQSLARTEADTESADGAEFSSELVDLSDESLKTLFTSSDSALSIAVKRTLEEGKTVAVASAQFNAFHP